MSVAADMFVVVLVSFPLSLLVVGVHPRLRTHCTARFRLVGEMSGLVGRGMASSCCALGERSQSRGLVGDLVRRNRCSRDLVVADSVPRYSFHSHALVVDGLPQRYSLLGQDPARCRDTVGIAPLVGVVWHSWAERTLAH